MTTKVHLVADARGRALSMAITGGNVNDTTMMTTVVGAIRVPRLQGGRARSRPDRVMADKGYPSKANRAWLRRRGIAATIPERDDQIAHRRKRPGRPIDFGAAAIAVKTSSSGASTSSSNGVASRCAQTKPPAAITLESAWLPPFTG